MVDDWKKLPDVAQADWKKLPDAAPPKPVEAMTDASGNLPLTAQMQPLSQAEQEAGAAGWFEPKSRSGASVRGFGQGATYGTADEGAGIVSALHTADLGMLAGLGKTGPGRYVARKALNLDDSYTDEDVDAIIDRAAAKSTYELTGQRGPERAVAAGQSFDAPPVLESYRTGRDEARRENATAKQEHGGYYGAAELAGGMLQPAPGGAKIQGLTKLGTRVVQGVGMGAAHGFGASEADTAGGVALDTVGSGVVGGIATPVIGKAFDKGADFLKWLANRNAAKAVGVNPGITNRLIKAGYETESDVQDFGQAIRNSGVVRPGRSTDDAQRRIAEDIERYGSMKSAIIEEAAAKQPNGADWKGAARTMEDKMEPSNGWDMGTLNASSRGLSEAQAVRDTGSGSLSLMEQQRRGLGQNLFNNMQDTTLNKTQTRSAYFGLRDAIRKQVADVSGSDVAQELADYDARMSLMMDANRFAKDDLTRRAAKGSGLLPLAGAIGGTMLGGSPINAAFTGSGGAALGTALNRIVGPHVPSTMMGLQAAGAAVMPGAAKAATTEVRQKFADDGALRKFLEEN